MKNFKQLVKELPSNKVVVAFGSFQPPTSVHEHLVKAVKTVAGKSADYAIYASANEDKKYNPLSVDRKVYFLNRMFPGTNFQETAETSIVGLAKKLNEKYKVLTVVVGEDKLADVQKQLSKANGKEYTFESIKVISTGMTDPDSDLTPGVSGLKMCESAKSGKFEDFKKGLPHTLTEHDSRRLMNEVRKGLGQEAIKEIVQFERTTVREQYIAGKIFNVGDKVQDDNGTYEIMDRGANYITVVNESGELSKKWIDKVTAIEKVAEDIQVGYAPAEISFKGYTTKNLHHSSDAVKAFQQTIAKYEGGAIQDGVAVLNALKATDTYMGLNDLHLEQGRPPIKSEVKEWIAAHMKAKESLQRTGDFLHHMDYWDSHGHELQMLLTNYAVEGAGDMADSYTPEGNMLPENTYNQKNDPDTKKIMMKYKDFIKKATMMEPPVDIGVPGMEAPKKTPPVAKGTNDKDGIESDIDKKIPERDPISRAGSSFHNPTGSENLRRQKVRYALGESYEEAEKHLEASEKAHKANDMFSKHMHLADYHGALANWHYSKNRNNVGDSHSDKAAHHEMLAHSHLNKKQTNEDVYASDTKSKDYQTQDAEGNWVWRKRKFHPKRVTFDASKMGGKPNQPEQQDEAYKKKSAYEKLNNRFKTITGRSLEDAGKEWEQHRKDTEARMKEYEKQGIIKKQTNEQVITEETHELGIDHDEPLSRHEHIKSVMAKHGGKVSGASDKSTYFTLPADKVHAAKKELKAGGVHADHWINGEFHEEYSKQQSYGSWVLKQKATPTIKKKKESKEKVEESVLNSADPHGDYKAKKKALQDIQLDKETHKDPELKKAVIQRHADLDREYQKYSKIGIGEEKKTLKKLKKDIQDKQTLEVTNKNPPFDAFSSTC